MGKLQPIHLSDYNPTPNQVRLYFCSYGSLNLLLKTLSTSYATVTPVLSVLLALLIMIALFQIRYIYGQDIEQLYYQNIETNNEYQRREESLNLVPNDTIDTDNKSPRILYLNG